MAFNLGSIKSPFAALKKMTPKERVSMLRDSQNSGAASPFTLLTPTEFAELFPKYYQRGLPDVGGFREALSRKERKSMGLPEKSDGTGASYYGEGKTVAKGNLAANQKEAYKAAREAGLSDSAARILVANMSGESLADPSNHHWDVKHMSQGIVQWDPERAERIRRQFGSLPMNMSVADQTKAAIWEMKTYYGKSWNALNDESMAAGERMHIVVGDYERPRDVGGSTAQRMRHFNGLPSSFSDQPDLKADTKTNKPTATPHVPVLDTQKSGVTINHEKHSLAAPSIHTQQFARAAGAISHTETASVSSAEFLTQRQRDKDAQGTKTALKDLPKYAQADTGTMTDASPKRNATDNKKLLFQAMDQYGLNDPRMRAALAAHAKGESNFQIPVDEMSYSRTSGSRLQGLFKTSLRGMSIKEINALKTDNKAFYNKIYGKVNGNQGGDDGWNFRGRGYVQLTGKENYRKYGNAIGVDLVTNPDMANDPKIAARIAVEYVKDRARIPHDHVVGRGRNRRVVEATPNDFFNSVTNAIGTPVKGVHEKKAMAFNEFMKSGEFHPQKSQFAQATKETEVAAGPLQSVPTAATPTQQFDPIQSADVSKTMTEPSVYEKAKSYVKSFYEGATSTAAPAPKAIEPTPSMMTDPVAHKVHPQMPTEVQTPILQQKVGEASRVPLMVNNPDVPKVPGASKGGKFDVGDANVNFYPMDRKDNIAAVNTQTQQPLFTAKTGENVSVDSKQNTIDVKPQSRVHSPIEGQRMGDMREVMDAMFDMTSQMGRVNEKPTPPPVAPSTPEHPVVIDSFLKQKTTGFSSPSLERAMNRNRGMESDHSANRINAGTSIA